jgi:L-seryl-tRNA(Ser) seleniumtransferase
VSETSASYRLLPAVDALLDAPELAPLAQRFGRALLLEAVRRDVDGLRARIRAGSADDIEALVQPQACADRLGAALAARTRPAYARALNATGVVLHTGLGRAPIAAAARERLAEVGRSFAVLEIERGSGKRGQRDSGITEIVRELTGAEAACVVNNNAGATLIALAALAHGRPVIVSRGQLVEIGGSYRIPDVMAQSGAQLVEVGATNRTHLRDYERALDAHPETALLLRVHTSNFQVVGFTREVELPELVALGQARGVEVMDDLGSGCLIDMTPFGLPREPVVGESLSHGAGVVTFSGDKLLGGPQAGIIVGKRELVQRIRKHPLYRALRPDKLILGALEATLALYRDRERVTAQVPTLAMLSTSGEALAARAEALAEQLRALGGLEVAVEASTSKVGGGSYAIEELPTTVVSVLPQDRSVDDLARLLREGDPALFTRVQDGRLKLDPRTLLGPAEDAEAAALVARALGR